MRHLKWVFDESKGMYVIQNGHPKIANSQNYKYYILPCDITPTDINNRLKSEFNSCGHIFKLGEL